MIIGDRISLIPMNDEIFNLTLKWINIPEIRYLTNSRFPVNEYEHKIWFDSKATDKYLKFYGIKENETGKTIGVVGLNDYDPISRNACPFMYIGDKMNQGKGYGTEALKLFISFLKNEMNVRRIYVYVADYNPGSLSMLMKCGFVVEGKMNKHWYKDGSYHDVIIAGLIIE